ncbi:hypothetical protein [Pseudomonas donghuensis]|nr:hypothetical protein [Pseudomonas donghuensis]
MPTQAQFLREVHASARRSTFEVSAWLGTLLALVVSLAVWALT